LVQLHGSVGYSRQTPWDEDTDLVEDWEQLSFLVGLRLLL
jgi:hypothetical protein